MDKCKVVQTGKQEFKIVNQSFEGFALCVNGKFKFKSEKQARKAWEESGFGKNFDMELSSKLYIE